MPRPGTSVVFRPSPTNKLPARMPRKDLPKLIVLIIVLTVVGSIIMLIPDWNGMNGSVEADKIDLLLDARDGFRRRTAIERLHLLPHLPPFRRAEVRERPAEQGNQFDEGLRRQPRQPAVEHRPELVPVQQQKAAPAEQPRRPGRRLCRLDRGRECEPCHPAEFVGGQ